MTDFSNCYVAVSVVHGNEQEFFFYEMVDEISKTFYFFPVILSETNFELFYS